MIILQSWVSLKLVSTTDLALIVDTTFMITSLPKVISKDGRIAALSHTYAVKSPWLQWREPNSSQKYPFPWADPQTALPALSLDPFDP